MVRTPVGKVYRDFSASTFFSPEMDRYVRPAPGEPGTLRQTFGAIELYLETKGPDRLRAAQQRRLWLIAKCLLQDLPIPIEAA